MKNIIIAIALFIAVIAQSSCAQTVTSSAVADNNSVFKPVLTSYFDLSNALIRDHADSARIAANSLHDAISKAPMDKMSADHHKAWMKYNEKLAYDAEHIKGSDDIEHQREHFVSLSANLYKLLKTLRINNTDLYYQYCPMANDGKGAYWISEQSKIVNPYMGKKMPSCGSTEETLKANQ